MSSYRNRRLASKSTDYHPRSNEIVNIQGFELCPPTCVICTYLLTYLLTYVLEGRGKGHETDGKKCPVGEKQLEFIKKGTLELVEYYKSYLFLVKGTLECSATDSNVLFVFVG